MECATPATRRILIVEDEAWCATTLEVGLLSLNDVEVLLAASVPKALHLLHSFRISLVVTDLNLPTINGFDLIAGLRSELRTATLPIVVVSGDTDPGARERAFHLGADAYFCKPFSMALLCQKIKQLLDSQPLMAAGSR